MRRRSITCCLACFILAPGLLAPAAAAMERPYRVSLIGDGYDGSAWTTGIRIELADGWKTYWRMPGEAGIPPDFTWKTSVPAEVEVAFPIPGRHHDASGETVGYAHEVVFPVVVRAGAATAVKLEVSLFFAVCRDICIPAKAEAAIELGSAVLDPVGLARVENAILAVPQPGTPITAANIGTENGRPALLLTLQEPVDDIFIETTSTAYFRGPVFSADGLQARLLIDNVANASALDGMLLKVTLSRGGQGLEQSITLP